MKDGCFKLFGMSLAVALQRSAHGERERERELVFWESWGMGKLNIGILSNIKNELILV